MVNYMVQTENSLIWVDLGEDNFSFLQLIQEHPTPKGCSFFVSYHALLIFTVSPLDVPFPLSYQCGKRRFVLFLVIPMWFLGFTLSPLRHSSFLSYHAGLSFAPSPLLFRVIPMWFLGFTLSTLGAEVIKPKKSH